MLRLGIYFTLSLNADAFRHVGVFAYEKIITQVRHKRKSILQAVGTLGGDVLVDDPRLQLQYAGRAHAVHVLWLCERSSR